jgi:gliding motility-associated lipoprotein GldH
MTGKRIKILRSNIIAVTFVLLVSLIYCSCSQQGDYYHFREIKSGTWSQHDTLKFEIDSMDIEPNVRYNISIEITNNNDYPYSNLWCYIENNIANDSIIDKTSHEFILADVFGKWNGSGFGALYQSSFQLTEQITFKEKKNYQIRILHGMRDEPLTGIEKVGIWIFRNDR